MESTTTLQEHAYDFGKAKIMNLDLKPGQYIIDCRGWQFRDPTASRHVCCKTL